MSDDLGYGWQGDLLDLASVQAKLVDRPRGGYCFEHNRLFAAVLERIGFEVVALTGRVFMGYYVSENPRSPFTRRPFVQRFSPEAHHVLDGTALTVTRPSGEVEKRSLTARRLPETPAEVFGIVLADGDAARLVKAVDTANLDV